MASGFWTIYLWKFGLGSKHGFDDFPSNTSIINSPNPQLIYINPNPKGFPFSILQSQSHSRNSIPQTHQLIYNPKKLNSSLCPEHPLQLSKERLPNPPLQFNWALCPEHPLQLSQFKCLPYLLNSSTAIDCQSQSVLVISSVTTLYFLKYDSQINSSKSIQVSPLSLMPSRWKRIEVISFFEFSSTDTQIKP